MASYELWVYRDDMASYELWVYRDDMASYNELTSLFDLWKKKLEFYEVLSIVRLNFILTILVQSILGIRRLTRRIRKFKN